MRLHGMTSWGAMALVRRASERMDNPIKEWGVVIRACFVVGLNFRPFFATLKDMDKKLIPERTSQTGAADEHAIPSDRTEPLPSSAPEEPQGRSALDKAATLGVLSLIWLIPAALVCLGLLGGCKALDWPPMLALAGLLHVPNNLPAPLALVRWATLPGAVIGALLYVFR